MKASNAKVIHINGPVVKGIGLESFQMREMVLVGDNHLIGEIIGMQDTICTETYRMDTKVRGYIIVPSVAGSLKS